MYKITSNNYTLNKNELIISIAKIHLQTFS